jgi:soluble lytic murein transglycosylase
VQRPLTARLRLPWPFRVRIYSKLAPEFFCVLILAASLAWGREANSVPAGLRQLAATATKPESWPRLRRYAQSRTDSEQRGWAYFVLGYREYDAGEYSGSIGDLREAAGTGFSQADYAAFYWASAAQQANDPLQVVNALNGFSAHFPESVLLLRAVELQAQALIDAHKPQDAIQALIAEPRVRQRPSLAILLAQAQLEAEQLQDAARAFQDIFYGFPNSAQSRVAGEELKNLQTRLGAGFPQPTIEIRRARAEALLKGGRYDDAFNEFGTLLQEARPASPEAWRLQLRRARCLVRMRRTSEALGMLNTSFAENPELDSERLSLQVAAYAQNDDATGLLPGLTQLQSLYPQSSNYASAMYAAASLFFRKGDWKNAARYYQMLADAFPRSSQARDATWRLAWACYFGQDHPRAQQVLKDYLSRFPDSGRTASALFWLARLEEEQGDPAEARALYTLLRKRFVHTYYAVRAGERTRNLRMIRPASERSTEPPLDSVVAGLAQTIPPPDAPPRLPCGSTYPDDVPHSLLTFSALGLEDLAEDYIKTGLSDRPKSPEERLFLSQIEAKQGEVAAALVDAVKSAPDYPEVEFEALPREMWDLLFPREYWSLVRRYARANRLDPYLVMGLIRQESAFNPRALSRANARGLMQVLPNTASRSRRPYRIQQAGRRLFEPAYNIRVGTAYFRGLLKQFNGNLEQALAAYNAGDFRAKDWVNRYPFQDPVEFLEAIPFGETRSYVEAVLRDAAIYRALLAGSPRFRRCASPSTVAKRKSKSKG